MPDQSQSSLKQELYNEELKLLLDKLKTDVNSILSQSINTAWNSNHFSKSLVYVIKKDLRLLEEWSNGQGKPVPDSEGETKTTEGWLIEKVQSDVNHIESLIGSYNHVASDVVSYLASHPGYIQFINAFTLDLVPNMLNEMTALLFGADGHTFKTSEEKETKQLQERVKEAQKNISTSVELLCNNAHDIILQKHRSPIL